MIDFILTVSALCTWLGLDICANQEFVHWISGNKIRSKWKRILTGISLIVMGVLLFGIACLITYENSQKSF
jgi:hypothetical protein